MMSKKELFEHLKTIKDKSGGFKKPESIKKNYPEIYDGIISSDFPTYWSFTQKLWHFLQDDFSIHRCKCGNELHFIDFKKGYRTYCSTNCPCVIEYNKITLQKAQETSRSQESRKKAVDTILEKNGGKFWSDENLERIRKPYKDNIDRCNKVRDAMIKNRPNMSEKIRNKIKENIKEFNELSGKTIEGCSSTVELQFYKYLISLFGFENVEPQYYSDVYPFACDFYIPNMELYIEIQGTWTHGGHPYTNSKVDKKKLDYWKSKCNEYYNNAIYTWTDLDIRKRAKAKENGLNYLEIFSNKIDVCKSSFEDYIKKLLLNWCLKNDLPGNSKWPTNHPIWDCNVDNRPSPKDAWKDKKYLTKAINNMFDMIGRYADFRVKHINEILKCKIKNNEIVSSTDRLLRLILDRFTIAKIAPKVTALSRNEMKKIIDESGIDISNGVYIPMAGFGGIVEGCRMWGENHNVEIEIEAYDINKNFCDWYGWSQRDMLKQKVKTDKVCICCPPFGKKFEHWNGTPNEMSDISFNDWYKLIKEYVDAPEYIIIGPEIGGKENAPSLFKKKVGIMRYTDEMIN